MASATTPAGRHGADVRALMDGGRGLPGCQVDGGQRPGHGADRLHGRTDAQHLTCRHAALGAARPAGAPPDHPVVVTVDLVVCGRSAAGRRDEPVADLHALDRLDAHQRRGQLRVQPTVPVDVGAQARRQPKARTSTTPPRVSPSSVRRFHLGHHRAPRLQGPACAPGRRQVPRPDPARQVGTPYQTASRADGDRVRDQRDSVGLPQKGRGHSSQSDPGRRLTRRGPLQDRAGVVEPVLLHAHQVGVTGTRRGSAVLFRAISCVAPTSVAAARASGRDRIRAHHRLPLGPLGVADRGSPAATRWSRHDGPRRGSSTASCSNSSGRPGQSRAGDEHGRGDVGGGDLDARGQRLRSWPSGPGHGTHRRSTNASMAKSCHARAQSLSLVLAVLWHAFSR
jgi:hypothetical protein